MNGKKKHLAKEPLIYISKARKELEQHIFLAWLSPFTPLRQIKSNLRSSEDNAGGETLDEDLNSSDDAFKAGESETASPVQESPENVSGMKCQA